MVINHSIHRERGCHGAQNTPDAPKTSVASSWNNSWRICRCPGFFLIRKNCWGESNFYLIKGLKCYTFDFTLVVIHFVHIGIGGVALLCFHLCIIDQLLLPKKKATAFIYPLLPAFCEEINVCWGGDSLLQDEDVTLINEGMWFRGLKIQKLTVSQGLCGPSA